jgi:hypothetical protein
MLTDKNYLKKRTLQTRRVKVLIKGIYPGSFIILSGSIKNKKPSHFERACIYQQKVSHIIICFSSAGWGEVLAPYSDLLHLH